MSVRAASDVIDLRPTATRDWSTNQITQPGDRRHGCSLSTLFRSYSLLTERVRCSDTGETSRRAVTGLFVM